MITPVSLAQRSARSLVISIAFLGMASTAHALPVFARKYQTSCQTCHIVFPKLNAFGEAFRLRGYRMPAETEDMVKQPPVSLGSPAYKKLCPFGFEHRRYFGGYRLKYEYAAAASRSDR